MVTRAQARTAPLRSQHQLPAAFEDLSQFGYCLLERALSDDAVQALRTRIDEQAAGERARGEAFVDSQVNQRIWMLPNKGRIFRDLVLDPLVERMMEHLLGPGFLLSSLTANIARPGGVPMYLHSDQGYVDFWTEKPLVANILVMLDDFTDENGGTRVVPGSHLRQDRRPFAPEETVAAEGPAGTMMVFDGRLGHGTGANRAESGDRRAVLAYHCRPFVRQQENYFLGLDPDLRRTEREAFLRRLGFGIWAGLGRVNHPADPAVLAPVERPTGVLSADGKPRGDDARLPARALWKAT